MIDQRLAQIREERHLFYIRRLRSTLRKVMDETDYIPREAWDRACSILEEGKEYDLCDSPVRAPEEGTIIS